MRRARCFPALDLDEAQAAHVRVGRALDLPLTELTALFAPDGEFLALYRDGCRDGLRRAPRPGGKSSAVRDEQRPVAPP